MLLGTKIEANVNGMALMIQLPTGLHVVDDEYVTEHDTALARADMAGWWTMPELVKRYHQNPTWFAENVFQVPRFMKVLRGQCVMYPREGVKGYTCEPEAFGEFMKKWFPEIARNAMKGGKS